jgi:ribonucleotide reductase alpha subunit
LGACLQVGRREADDGPAVAARDLWQRILRAAYETGEPGVIFSDRVRRENNLHYCETISATNPCGEVHLPPYGCCDLGSLNLTRFVHAPFTPQAGLDLAALIALVPVAVRMPATSTTCRATRCRSSASVRSAPVGSGSV